MPPLPAEPASDPWERLRRHTPARIALGRAGASLPTREVLAFGEAHAVARDAVHAQLDVTALAAGLSGLGLPVIDVRSRAPDRAAYLRRPDLGRQLSAEDAAMLSGACAGPCDVGLVVADGLSATAVAAHAVATVASLLPRLEGLSLSPAIVATQARVALGDAIGEALGVKLLIMLIGERPGLSAADSLGCYLTFAPRIGRNDAQRNCISNIRPEGLDPDQAAMRIAWLARTALERGLTGVALKDESGKLPSSPDIPMISTV